MLHKSTQANISNPFPLKLYAPSAQKYEHNESFIFSD